MWPYHSSVWLRTAMIISMAKSSVRYAVSSPRRRGPSRTLVYFNNFHRHDYWIPAFERVNKSNSGQILPSSWPCLTRSSRKNGSISMIPGWPPRRARLSGLINEQYQGVIPERRASRVLSGIHLTACASFDMDSRQSPCDFGNDVEDNRKQNEPDSRGLDPAMTKESGFDFFTRSFAGMTTKGQQ